jgi:hypothetical protein
MNDDACAAADGDCLREQIVARGRDGRRVNGELRRQRLK